MEGGERGINGGWKEGIRGGGKIWGKEKEKGVKAFI